MSEATYWQKQAAKHSKMAATLLAKYQQTGEARWLKQSRTNAQRAAALTARFGSQA